MKRSTDKELMDLPGKSVDLFIDDLRHLRQFNRYLGGSRSVIKGLESLVGAKNVARLSILDVGTGSADIPYTLQEWRELFQRAGIGPFRISPRFPFRQITVIGLGG